jgi:A/G-specific adenine glycosylase
MDGPDPEVFRDTVLGYYAAHGRHDLPWRLTTDPYSVLVSEVMLQQTQVPRVLKRYPEWIVAFPTVDALAAAPLAEVLERWQGLGYNRRAIALKRAAEEISSRWGGAVPSDEAALKSLPGVGSATAAGVRVFAFGLPAVYLETNVRSVFLHHFFADANDVPDAAILPLVVATTDRDDPRSWYYALLDYGAHLKKTVPNPSRRSRHHSRQSAFEGSRRQKRARLLRAVLAAPGCSANELAVETHIEPRLAAEVLDELVAEGFMTREEEGYSVS